MSGVTAAPVLDLNSHSPVAKRIGTMNESSLSAISAGGGGNGAARLIRSSASASSGADPELLTIRLLTMLPCRSMLKARLTYGGVIGR